MKDPGCWLWLSPVSLMPAGRKDRMSLAPLLPIRFPASNSISHLGSPNLGAS